MERYRNLGGNSGVCFYEIGEDSITVQFRDGAKYLYDNRMPGRADVAKMKSLATIGEGLNSYISKYVRKRFSRKIR